MDVLVPTPHKSLRQADHTNAISSSLSACPRVGPPLGLAFSGLSDTTMEPSWKPADVFPIIARIIEQAYREHRQFITAQEIAARLLEDTAGRNLVEAAHEQQGEKQSLEWLASNMVSWFSQRITVGESEWARAFERAKIDGLWAYRPVTQGNG